MRICLLLAAFLVAVIGTAVRAAAQAATPSDDPLRHGHALLIGNSHYRDPRWAALDDVQLQIQQLKEGLKDHFDDVEVAEDFEALPLLAKINDFIRERGNEGNTRLFIYYAGHGYTQVQRNEMRGYITGVDTPSIDGTTQGYNAARRRAIDMVDIRAALERSPAKSILFMFDSCFAGTIFTSRSDPPRLTKDIVARLIDKPARDIITAGLPNERVPAHSPIPSLLLAALNGAADPNRNGVISSMEIYTYLRDHVLPMNINLTPQWGRLPDGDFAEGAFLFRVIGQLSDENETISRHHVDAAKGSVSAQVLLTKLAADQGLAYGQAYLGLMYENGRGGLAKDDREAVRL
jgi:hypothetical protein